MLEICIACGMPMEKPEDHALGNVTRSYCLHCARPDGSMRSYEEAVAGMSQFMMRSQGLDENAAREAVIAIMKKLPAWKDQAE